jgi:hypothetical protein
MPRTPQASPVPAPARLLAKRLECGAFRRFGFDFVNGPGMTRLRSLTQIPRQAPG